ncbi:protein GOLVEN 2 [Manihot esculenta]|uniref:Root meristem growth factor 9 n=1 Tax=Manihot esculenta TaxID=3983 RepID=A0A2C9UYJ8_MANES|nr:protein GOLVEN 2 [Manihot esculenta]
MAKLPCKNLLLVAFFLLCFVTIGAKARNLKVANDMNEVEKKMKEQEENSFTSKGNEVAPDADELLGMDYTGPKKKPPIHN